MMARPKCRDILAAMRLAVTLIAVAGLSVSAFARDPLPEPEPDDAFEIEPPVLIPNRDRESRPKNADAEEEEAAPQAAPAPDIEKLQNDLHRAERNASGAEHLYKIGAIAKVDAENRLLRVIRLRAELAKAELAVAKENLLQLQQHPEKAQPQQLHEAESTLAHAIEASHAADAEREKTELSEAETNLARQRKLLALGSGRKSEVAKAEQKLAELKAPKNE